MPVFSLAQHSSTQAKNERTYFSRLEEYKLYLDGVARRNADRLDKRTRKDYIEIIARKNAELLTELKENNFLFDSEITNYLRSIFYYVLEKNNLDKKGFYFFVTRTDEVNASAYEDGTIICNLGLLDIMESESQIAMVFCHEIAHFLLDHVNHSILKTIENYNSPEFLTRVKEIKKEKYNTKKQLEDLLITDLFNRRRHNRSQELSADSLGMMLLSKTGYGSAAIPHLFDLLNSSDSIVVSCPIAEFCRKENIDADQNWFSVRKKLSFGTDTKKEIEDTLKTHPDCSIRKIYAREFFTKYPRQGPDFVLGSKVTLASIKELALFEESRYSKDKERLGYYLYQLIQNDARFPADKSIKQEIFEVFLTISLQQKKHKPASHVDKPYATENTNDEYAKLLKMLDAVDLDKMKSITNNYLEKHKEVITLTGESNNYLQELNKK